MLPCYHGHIDDLAWNCGSSSADALELQQCYAVSSVSVCKCFIHKLPCYHGHIDGLAWNCGSSSTDTLELLQFCAVPSMSVRKLLYTYIAMLPWSYWWLGVELWWLQCWHWSCCSLALCHQCQYASCSIRMLPCYHGHIDGLAWNCGGSSADALELQQSYAVPSASIRKLLYTYVAMLPWLYWWLDVELW